jgi:hypothetical protein
LFQSSKLLLSEVTDTIDKIDAFQSELEYRKSLESDTDRANRLIVEAEELAAQEIYFV